MGVCQARDFAEPAAQIERESGVAPHGVLAEQLVDEDEHILTGGHRDAVAHVQDRLTARDPGQAANGLHQALDGLADLGAQVARIIPRNAHRL